MYHPEAIGVKDPSAEELLYFAGDERLLPVYLALRGKVIERYPESDVRVQKSQISYRFPHPYLWVWTLAGHGSRKPGKGPMFVTFASPFPIESPMIYRKVEPYPGRWTHHVALLEPGAISDELLGLIEASYRFRNGKPGKE